VATLIERCAVCHFFFEFFYAKGLSMTPINQPFTVFLIQSAHTDIGYTHPQEQIERMSSDFYDKVLELCKRTEHDPLPQRFKWVCETSWQVKVYLMEHPERLEEFVYYVRHGQIEMTAAYLHFTDLIDEDAYRRSLDWVANFCQQYDLPLRTAMHCDINGWSSTATKRRSCPAILHEPDISLNQGKPPCIFAFHSLLF
jgi:hypothetical protein